MIVHPAEVAVPSDGNHIGKHETVLKGQEGKVDSLDCWPDVPIGLEGCPPCRLELVLRASSLHGSHAAEEDTNHNRSKDELITSNTRNGGELLVHRVNMTGQQVVPGVGDGSKDDWFMTYQYLNSEQKQEIGEDIGIYSPPP